MYKEHIFALACGIIAGVFSNNKSNIHPLLLGIIFAILFTKLVFGDYDRGYQFSSSDLLFALVVGGEGAIGAWISKTLI